MLLLRVLWFGAWFLFIAWLIIDVLIPLIRNKPIMTMFKSNKKAELDAELRKQNETMDELDLEEKIRQNQDVIDERRSKLEPETEIEQEQVETESEVKSETEKEQN